MILTVTLHAVTPLATLEKFLFFFQGKCEEECESEFDCIGYSYFEDKIGEDNCLIKKENGDIDDDLIKEKNVVSWEKPGIYIQ